MAKYSKTSVTTSAVLEILAGEKKALHKFTKEQVIRLDVHLVSFLS